MPAKFCHYIYADDQVTFCLVLHFVSRVATVRMFYRKVERRSTTVRMFNRDRNFKVRNDFTIAKDFPRFKGLDVTVMKVFRWVEKQLYAGPNQLSLPFYSQFTLCIYTATNGLGEVAKTDFAPGRRNP